MSDLIILAGSNGKNLELAKKFQDYIAPKFPSTELLDLVSLELPLYSSDEEKKGIPKKALELFEKMSNAKGFLFVQPEYNGGLPPVVTNFLNWISRSGGADWRKAFNSKPAALATFSGGGGFHALMALRIQLSYMGLNTIGRDVRATFQQELNPEDLEAVSDLLIKALN